MFRALKLVYDLLFVRRYMAEPYRAIFSGMDVLHIVANQMYHHTGRAPEWERLDHACVMAKIAANGCIVFRAFNPCSTLLVIYGTFVPLTNRMQLAFVATLYMAAIWPGVDDLSSHAVWIASYAASGAMWAARFYT